MRSFSCWLRARLDLLLMKFSVSMDDLDWDDEDDAYL